MKDLLEGLTAKLFDFLSRALYFGADAIDNHYWDEDEDEQL